ncbi:bifunctional 2-polyprenyl-6-hydroxyphenol methylase/3-demethylubiquinol 3-O-methyltransferase UbiG [Herbaspirillum sp. RV1423]|uniref:class I SAM-dependent methyltransferase n=1 Tax=Herbaspirillum sp. RV1423 TaxID=1443993 RepID=UPI0004ADBA30|nr:class I SAM-dependent methyltransferase [Herbaspirillum sp. RV1423]
MDQLTLAAYDKAAASFAQDWHDQPAPEDLYALVQQHFVAGSVADIGCGSGREVGWLASQGFAATGYDASQGLLDQAKLRYPQQAFHLAALPALDGIADASFDNVLCETVIMHLPRAQIVPAVRRLWSLVKPGGVLYLSWRVTKEADQRDKHERLYAAFDASLVKDALNNASYLLDEEVASMSSGKTIHRLIATKQ